MDRDDRGLFIAGIAVSLVIVLLMFIFGRPISTRHQETRSTDASSKQVKPESAASVQTAAPESVPNAPEETMLVGEISDTMCGRQHKGPDPLKAHCAETCIGLGANYALVVGERIYALKGYAADIKKFAGQTVTARGTVTGDTLVLESIALTHPPR